MNIPEDLSPRKRELIAALYVLTGKRNRIAQDALLRELGLKR